MLVTISFCTSFSSDELHDLDEDDCVGDPNGGDWELENDSIEMEGMGAADGEIIDRVISDASESDHVFVVDENNFGLDDNRDSRQREYRDNDSVDSSSAIISPAESKRHRSKDNNTKKSLVERFVDIFPQDLIQRIHKQFMKSPLQQFRFPHIQFQFHHTCEKKSNNKRAELGAQKSNPFISRFDRGLAMNYGGHSIGRGNSAIVDFETSRRVGALCNPSSDGNDEKGSDTFSDKSIVACFPDPEKGLDEITTDEDCETDGVGISDAEHNYFHFDENKDDDIKPGSVVFVLPSADANWDQEDYGSDHSVIPIEHGRGKMFGVGDDSASEFVATGTRCLSQVGRYYDHDDQVIQYIMLQKESHEMGNIDVHKKDFAYQPVSLGTVEDTNSRIYRHFAGNEIEARINPEQEAVEVVSNSPSLTTRNVVGNQNLNQRSSWTNENDDTQVSFRWWSWVSHLSQFVHSGSDEDENSRFNSRHRSKYDHHHQPLYQSNLYEEEGQHAFAGGSYGEVWRARRRCPERPKAQKMKQSQQADEHSGRNSCDERELIAKRLKIEHGYPVLEAGLREVYFGELLAREVESSSLFTTYVDHFFRKGKNDHLELWIVFEHGGQSLRSYLYTPVVDSIGGFMVFQHSSFWRRLRRGIVRSSANDSGGRARAVAIANTYPHKSSQSKDGERSSDEKGSKISQPQSAGTEEEDRRHPKQSEPEGRVLLKEVLRQIITSVSFLHERGIVHR